MDDDGKTNTFTVEQGLLQGIMQSPDDDSRRLVYADWLEENDAGDGKRTARAEFIRTQIELEHVKKNDPRWEQLRDREDRLWGAQCRDWEPALVKLGAREGCTTFRRGFPENILIETPDFLRNAEQLFALAPITSISLHDPKGANMQELARSPYLTRLTRLNLGGNFMRMAGAIALANSPHVANLQKLELGGNYINIDGIRALANSPHLANLRSLGLGANALGEDGARILTESPYLTNLRSLDLGGNLLDDTAARIVAESPNFAQLTDLSLSENRISEQGIRALTRSPHLTKLRSLNLSKNPINNSGVQVLAESPRAHSQKEAKPLHRKWLVVVSLGVWVAR